MKTWQMNPIEITRLIKWYNQSEYNLEITSEDINGGDCYWWALVFVELIGGVLYTYGHQGGHAFVKFDGRWYDAESPNGVLRWQELKCIEGNDPDDYVDAMGLREFLVAWKVTPSCFSEYMKKIKSFGITI